MHAKLSYLAALLLVAAAPAMAQTSGAVETRLEAHKVVLAADGKESFVPADAARPGDEIEYVATYRNTGSQPVRNLQATLPIPADTELVRGTARPANARASLDGNAFAAMPLMRKVVRDGKSVEEEVPYREYRFLRWFPGELGGDKTASFAARVKVLADTTPGEAGSKGKANE